jgi:hypothetical protein
LKVSLVSERTKYLSAGTGALNYRRELRIPAGYFLNVLL